MNEKALTQELHRVADAAPVPADLFPSDLLSRPAAQRRPRPRWMAVAVAAAALLIFLVTPLGSRAVTAAGELIMQVTVKLVKTENPAASLPYIDMSAIQVGQTVVKEVPGWPKQVATGLLLKDLEPGWPLPAYMAPGPEATVIRFTVYKEGTDQPTQESINVVWQENGHSLQYSLGRRTEPMAAADLKKLQSGEMSPVTVYTNNPDAKVEQKQVLLQGQPASATKIGNRWSLYWYHELGGGSVAGNVELEELLKIAESLPSMK